MKAPFFHAALFVLCSASLLTACGGAVEPPPRGGGSGDGPEGADEAIAVRVAPVVRASLANMYVTSATVRSDRRASITARTRGVVRRLLVEAGDEVVGDQPVAELENDEQRIELERARTTFEQKERVLDRARGLHESHMLSDEDFEQTRREAEDAQQAVALADLLLSRTVIRSPFAGAILKRHLDVGATVSDGTPVYDVADLEPLYVDVNVPERHVARLGVGQRVRLRADATGIVVTGSIERIAPEVDTATGTVAVAVAIAGSTPLRPGAFVNVDIVTDTHDDALVVPRAALVAEGRRWHLFRLGADRASVARLEVRLGYEEGDRVEVAGVEGDGELVVGNDIVVSGAAALNEGSRVEVMGEVVPPRPAKTGDQSGNDRVAS